MATIDSKIKELLHISYFKKEKIAVVTEYSEQYNDEYCRRLLKDIAKDCRSLNIYKMNIEECKKISEHLSAEEVYLNMLRLYMIADTGIKKHAIPRIWLPIIDDKLRVYENEKKEKSVHVHTPEKNEYQDFIDKIKAPITLRNARQMCRKVATAFENPVEKEIDDISVEATVVLNHLEKLSNMLYLVKKGTVSPLKKTENEQ